MNTCDYEHMTNEETRLMYRGAGDTVILCKHHYSMEMNERAGWADDISMAEELSMFPSWNSLQVYAEAVTVKDAIK